MSRGPKLVHLRYVGHSAVFIDGDVRFEAGGLSHEVDEETAERLLGLERLGEVFEVVQGEDLEVELESIALDEELQAAAAAGAAKIEAKNEAAASLRAAFYDAKTQSEIDSAMSGGLDTSEEEEETAPEPEFSAPEPEQDEPEGDSEPEDDGVKEPD